MYRCKREIRINEFKRFYFFKRYEVILCETFDPYNTRFISLYDGMSSKKALDVARRSRDDLVSSILIINKAF